MIKIEIINKKFLIFVAKPLMEAREKELENFNQLLAEEVMDLFVIPSQTISAHVLEYIRQKDVREHFRIQDVTLPAMRPKWLQGVPTIVFRTNLKNNKFAAPEARVGEEALRHIRATIDGHQDNVGTLGDPEDDLEVIDAHDRGNNSSSTYETPDICTVYNDEEELLQYLLPLKTSVSTGRTNDRITEAEINRAIDDRNKAFG